MAEIRRSLGCITPSICGINYQSQLVKDFSYQQYERPPFCFAGKKEKNIWTSSVFVIGTIFHCWLWTGPRRWYATTLCLLICSKLTTDMSKLQVSQLEPIFLCIYIYKYVCVRYISFIVSNFRNPLDQTNQCLESFWICHPPLNKQENITYPSSKDASQVNSIAILRNTETLSRVAVKFHLATFRIPHFPIFCHIKSPNRRADRGKRHEKPPAWWCIPSYHSPSPCAPSPPRDLACNDFWSFSWGKKPRLLMDSITKTPCLLFCLGGGILLNFWGGGIWLFLFQRFSGTKNIKWFGNCHLKEMGDIEKGTYNKMKQQFLPNNLPKTFTLFNSNYFFGEKACWF